MEPAGRRLPPRALQQALERDRTLWEFNAMVRPMADLRLYRATMATWPSSEQYRRWLADNDRFRRDVLERLAAEGPLPSKGVPDTSQVPWASTGWTKDRNVTQMLEFLVMRGEVAVAGRRGQGRRPHRPADGVLRVDAVHEDVPFDRALRRAVRAELEDLAAWLDVALDGPGVPA